jgi:hypothetical protein
MSASKNPLEVVWAIHPNIEHAGMMTRAMLATSAGWHEVDESHPKVLAALGKPTTEPDRATPKEVKS